MLVLLVLLSGLFLIKFLQKYKKYEKLSDLLVVIYFISLKGEKTAAWFSVTVSFFFNP